MDVFMASLGSNATLSIPNLCPGRLHPGLKLTSDGNARVGGGAGNLTSFAAGADPAAMFVTHDDVTSGWPGNGSLAGVSTNMSSANCGGGGNDSSSGDFTAEDWWDLVKVAAEGKSDFKRIMAELNIYLTPLIIFIGVTGNLLSFLVFSLTHLRRSSSSVYLASLALVDTGFLLSLFVVWLSFVKVPLFQKDGWCQLVVYLTHVCQFLSVWFVVSFTAERYIIVWHPLRKDRYCTPKRAKLVVSCLGVFALTAYSFTTWTSGVMVINGMPVCMPFPQYYDVLTFLTSIDTLITLLLPSLIIVILNFKIVIKIYQIQKQRTEHNGGAVSLVVRNSKVMRNSTLHASVSNKGSMHFRFSNNKSTTDVDTCTAAAAAAAAGAGDGTGAPPSPQSLKMLTTQQQLQPPLQDGLVSGGDALISHKEPPPPPQQQRQQKNVQSMVTMRGNSQYRLARMLLVVSSIFVLLNVPSHYFRIQAFMQHLLGDSYKGSIKELRWQELFQLIYYLNFGINFFIYSLCGRPFRSGLRRLCARIKHQSRKCCTRDEPLTYEDNPRRFTHLQNIHLATERRKRSSLQR